MARRFSEERRSTEAQPEGGRRDLGSSATAPRVSGSSRQKTGKPLKVAIVHDWLVGGGAERVVYELHRMFPDAPIYTSYATDEWRQRLDGKVVTGFLQHWPFSRLRKFLAVLRIWWFTRLDFSGYDLVISSTGNGEAKGIRVPEGTVHICYCHTPTHFYWRYYNKYLKRPGFGAFDPLARIGLRLLVGPLRRWDLKASKRPDVFVANSTHIQRDIKQYYGRNSAVVYPPIDISRFEATSGSKRSGFITVGRQVPAKHTDLVVMASTKLNLPLTVIGNGPEHRRLRKLAGPSVTFKTDATDEDVARAMAGAAAFIFASQDDFGITPIEAMAAGAPVIAYKGGGALDYVLPGVTGEYFPLQTAESLANVLRRFEPSHYHPAAIRKQAEQFAPEVFRRNMQRCIDEALRVKKPE